MYIPLLIVALIALVFMMGLRLRHAINRTVIDVLRAYEESGVEPAPHITKELAARRARANEW